MLFKHLGPVLQSSVSNDKIFEWWVAIPKSLQILFSPVICNLSRQEGVYLFVSVYLKLGHLLSVNTHFRLHFSLPLFFCPLCNITFDISVQKHLTVGPSVANMPATFCFRQVDLFPKKFKQQ